MYQEIRMKKVARTWRSRWLTAVLLLGVVAGIVAAAEPKPVPAALDPAAGKDQHRAALCQVPDGFTHHLHPGVDILPRSVDQVLGGAVQPLGERDARGNHLEIRSLNLRHDDQRVAGAGMVGHHQ